MKTTFEEAFTFVDTAKEYINRIEQSKAVLMEIRDLTPAQINFLELYFGKKLIFQSEETEAFIYALKKVAKRITTKTIAEFQNIITDNQIDLCEADEKMEPKKDDKGNLIFTKESMKKRNSFQLNASMLECSIEEYHVNVIPNNLTTEEREIFTGFVIPLSKKIDKKQLTNN